MIFPEPAHHLTGAHIPSDEEPPAPSAALRPCPFCGGPATVENYIIEAVARCTECFAKITRRHSPTEDVGLRDAINAWNTRCV